MALEREPLCATLDGSSAALFGMPLLAGVAGLPEVVPQYMSPWAGYLAGPAVDYAVRYSGGFVVVLEIRVLFQTYE